jgi:hypothetical protein
MKRPFRRVRQRAQRQPRLRPNGCATPGSATANVRSAASLQDRDSGRGTHQIARPGVGGSRAVRVEQAGVKTDHSQPRQIGPRIVDGGSVSDSQTDSAGSIPVTRSIREYCGSRTEFEDSCPVRTHVFGLRPGHLGHTIRPRHPFSFRRTLSLSRHVLRLSGSPVLRFFQPHPSRVSATTTNSM